MAELETDGANGVNGLPSPADQSTTLDPQIILDYLSRLLSVTLGASSEDLHADGSLLSESNTPDTVERCTQFLHDAQTVLYVQKVASPVDIEVNGNGGTRPSFSYALSLDLTANSRSVASVALLKAPQPVDLSVPLSEQIQIVNLPGLSSFGSSSSRQYAGTPFELIHALVRSALTPYFDAASRQNDASGSSKSRGDLDQRTGIPGAKKKLAEFELSLLQLQQNAEIPQLALSMHPQIQAALDRAEAENADPGLGHISKSVLADSAFHNSLQSLVNGWIKSIQTVTKTTRDPANGTAAQEINFWLDLEVALDNIEVELQSHGVSLTLEVLKYAKRFMSTFSLNSDTGLKATKELVHNYNQLMREFPIDELLSAPSLTRVEEAIEQIFGHINKKLRLCLYPIRRALPLVDAISGDLNTRVRNLLNGRHLMQMSFRDFEHTMKEANAVWQTWDENIKNFTNVARELTRRRSERFIPIKLSPRHTQTQDRLQYVAAFRTSHEQLQHTIRNVLAPGLDTVGLTKGVASQDAALMEDIGDVDAVEEVSQAYAALRDVDVLDVTPEGTMAWDQAETVYNERTSRVENSIIARLRDRLATAKTANEMFRVFSQFNALFIRPKIRGAISEYQTQLIDNVKHDISSLQERFKQQYGHSQAHAMAQLRDIPPVSGAIIWARQIERQLEGYMKKVEDVLGTQWHLHSEGQKLRDESDSFRKKLDTRPIYQSWVQDVQRRNISISGRLFNINRNRAAGNVLELSVNFDAHVITLFKEVRNLLWLNFSVPHAINNASKDARRVYPFAVSLMESVRTFLQTSQAISGMPDVSILLDGYRSEVLSLIEKGIPLRWESFVHAYDLHVRESRAGPGATESTLNNRTESKHVQFIRDFSYSVSVLQNKAVTLSSVHESISQNISRLHSCAYDFEEFNREVTAIQSAVDRLSLENFANLRHWVNQSNAQIEEIFFDRLRDALKVWVREFEDSEAQNARPQTAGSAPEEHADLGLPRFGQLVHEISMRNQLMYLEPPLEYARSSWISQLHVWLGHVCDQKKLQASRYEINLESSDQQSTNTFTSLLVLCAAEIASIYQVIEAKLDGVQSYVNGWLQFQSLWDLQGDQVYESLGDDLELWLQLLQEIRKKRSTFDTTESQRHFGIIAINYEQVQMKINSKYDAWQNEILSKFSAKLQTRIFEVHAELQKARKELESTSLEASSTIHAVSFITTLQNIKKKINVWGPQVESFKQGQTVLTRQRHSFPSDWTYVESVEHEWNALNEILRRKSKIVADQTDALRAKVTAEDKVIMQRVDAAIAEWNEGRPISGTIPATDALRTLDEFDTRLTRLSNEFDMLSKAKEALDLPPSTENTITSVLEEVYDFKSVWSGLKTIWDGIGELRETLWASVNVRKLRHSLENLLALTKDMPSRMHQYEAFQYVRKLIQQLIKVNPTLDGLRSDAMRERHWIRIFKELNPRKRYSQLSTTLGDVWDLNLLANESTVKDVLSQAQGEMALEEYLRQVRETWQNYSLDLVAYQNKCRLIRGWDDLFSKCSDNLNSLQAMQHSPYYREFEEEASSWEEKLNRIYVLFDVWIDVQRQWVYLEGVFSGNADIKHLLPMESSRFQSINSEFFAVMKKVQRSPFVLDVLSISGVQKSLERLLDLLNKIQKALGEYLERERSSFPRFYFVGDEDLLEIIGNRNDISRIGRHLGKMFAGISGLIVEEETEIVGFRSGQGEEVALQKNVSLVKTPRVNEWLGALEQQMKNTLAQLLSEAVEMFPNVFDRDQVNVTVFEQYLDTFPTQIVVLAAQVWWTSSTQAVLENAGSLSELHKLHVALLERLAKMVINDLTLIQRKKCEHLVTEFVFQRDKLESLIEKNVQSAVHHQWLIQLRYSYDPEAEPLQRLHIKMANADLTYGYEYLGISERLVRTPLTDRCFLTLTQALEQRLGGSPYGPAGTGKTETVKALGQQLGRFTLVFCCDDSFDFQAMGRIFLGICQVGAWGCFDEFNRLEERILSAVSQQIQNIQLGVKRQAVDPKNQIELAGRQLQVNPSTGIFITMNPGYAGRSNLPDNLKKLFRSVAMSRPDKELIAEVTLYSQGFNRARELSRQVVPFFDLCSSKLSKEAHYDFGLRALKSVLISSGGLKRIQLNNADEDDIDYATVEPQIILQSLRETISPKLVREDVVIMQDIEAESFPGVKYIPAALDKLRDALRKIGTEKQLEISDTWLTKAIQLYQIQQLHHGVMMVGNSGAGKSATWTVLLQALQEVEGVEGTSYVIDPKVMSKEALYGTLDNTTREWTDGLFTSILRKIIDNLRGESAKRHWIVFDGDVDPEWVENLNSVLDDNKLLTLPNGERLVLPANVRVMFEVETLKHATLATVSRCGMVWFNDDNVSSDMIVANYIKQLRTRSFDDIEEDASTSTGSSRTFDVQNQVADVIQHQFVETSLILQALERAQSLNHIMTFTQIRGLNTFFSLLGKICRSVIEYNVQHSDFLLDPDQVQGFATRKALLALVWSFAGDCPLQERQAFGNDIANLTTVDLSQLASEASIIDYDVSLPEPAWIPWQDQVPNIEVNTHSVTQSDIVIPTIDTVRHEDVLYSWLAEHRPLILCGPPGSGKTMTLFSALRKLPDMEVVGLNFSSATTPDLLMKSFEQHCEYRKGLNGVTLSPTQIGRWLVVFCDEINLPAPDKYKTQRVISFLRQLIEHNGFWRTSDKTWVTLERIQFVGACNPPTDAGRVPLGLRFLRHAPLVMVDYPGKPSLLQIYGTFNNAVLKAVPALRGYASALTEAMVELYAESQSRFTPKIQPHYVYSPRELTRWVRGVYEAISPLESLDVEGLVRIWAHEALRLFQDRLIEEEERTWTVDAVKRIANTHFPNLDSNKALGMPILFSNWLSKNYVPVDRDQLRDFVKARLRTFCEEEIDVPLILYDDLLEHVLRIDRVFRQPQGHVILIGVSGSGKTTLARFVAWMNGLKVFQIKVHGRYSPEDFDEDLRNVLRRCGTKGEKICFIMDESNVLDSAFLERMNTLLANAEVPGLFEGDEYSALMTACREGAQRQGLIIDSVEELYRWFTQQIARNLHVVFTMNPPEEGLSAKAATSPALFNRCVLNWFGDWSDQTLFQVGYELTQPLDLDRNNYSPPDTLQVAYRDLNLPPSHREVIINAMVYVHHSIHRFNRRLRKQQNRITYLTPRHFLDFVAQYTKLYDEKRDDLEEQQRHLNVGLEKLRETVDKVRELRKSLAGKKSQLEQKDKEANEKLEKMMGDQKQAEASKAEALETQQQLEEQGKRIAERKTTVQADLDRAEPAVAEAQKSVSNIKRQQLTEVRSMTNPPAGVRLALEAVCTLLGHKVSNWKDIQGVVRREDFIASIVGYNTEKQMTASHRAKMRKEFLSNEDFTYERVNRASKACGPLVQWVSAQVDFSEIIDSVGPMREEVDELERKQEDTQAKAVTMQQGIQELEKSIALYKSEYAALISQTETIKQEMARVQQKVNRSLQLLDSLASERKRWEEGSKLFDTQIETIVGDTLVAAAFIAYGGLYDQQYRRAMLEEWFHHLSLAGVKFKAHNTISEYLSTADERLQWQNNTLPVDDLCTENAIILKNFNRYPLIIDPSGRIVDFLRNEFQSRKLTVTSFLDGNFVKQLESALRFGNPILIQDSEYLDPILNHVLNREYQKTGGRVLIQLGNQEIDFSPSFKLFLYTRDPSAHFAPDVCSRTTFVNFTVTQSSLQTQSLNDVLKSERPDVDERRSNLIKMQGEFRIELRRHEKRLLQALNEAQGNILDNDAVVDTLENVKKEVGIITAKVSETEGVMAEVEDITSEYAVVARSCSAIFAVLEQLRHINHFYQFSLHFFTAIFETVLTSAKSANFVSQQDHKTRVNAIVRLLFETAFRRTSISMLQRDRMTLAMLLVQAAPYNLEKSLFDSLLDADLQAYDVSSEDSQEHQSLISKAQGQTALKNQLQDVDVASFESFIGSEVAENHTPFATGNDLNSSLRSLLLVKMLRADRLIPAAEKFVIKVFGERLLDYSSDLSEVLDQVSATTPISLCCTPGFDASFKVDAVVQKRKMRCTNIAMGSNESLSSADKAISEAAASGGSVFVKNVHLAIAWLQGLEKRLDALKPHPDFRLFLSMDMNPKIPVNLLRISRVVMCEQPAGIRANIRDSLFPAYENATKAPVERTRLYLLLSILNGVIQERLRYAPTLGWNASWEFNDSDYDCSAHVLDTWIEWAAGGRSNIAPSNIPWEMIRILVFETYGGKIDKEEDFSRLGRLVNGLLTPSSFEEGFDVKAAVTMPEADIQTGVEEPSSDFVLPSTTSWKDFTAWVDALPEREPPSWLGLPSNAEKLLLVEQGKDMVRNMRTVMEILDESEQVMAEAEAETSAGGV